ncbi:MAG: hypothetical protein IJR50_05650 [Treponema sp.]|nr:hypothetical protein [Treponema sp.]
MAKQKTSGGNFFQNLFASLFGSDDPEVEKKRKLKAIAKKLSKAHYHFYKAGSDEVLPAFAKLLYEIYKAIVPAQNMLQNAQNQNAIKQSVIEYFLSDNQRKLEEQLTEEAIVEKSKTMPVKQLTKYMQETLDAFIGDFTAERIAAIEQRYWELLIFKDFCSFDFYFVLKKFDASLVEKQFSATPQFGKIAGDYVVDDIKDFTTVIANLTEVVDWLPLMKMLKDMRGVEPVAPGVWKKIVTRMQSIQASNVFDMMVQLITANPDYVATTGKAQTSIVDPFINKFKIETTAAMRKLESAEKNSKVNDVLSQLFGTLDISYLKNYTAPNSIMLEKKKLRGYTYHEPLNYLKAFLIEFGKTDIREYCELVLVRGKWTETSLSQPMSNAYNDLLSASDTITTFDQTLAEDGTVGIKIKTLLPRTGHDADSASIINRLVGEANNEARTLIMESTRNLITIGKMMKSLIEDEVKKAPEMLTNWKEIEKFSDTLPREIAVASYKRIYLLTTLMQTCLASAQ